MNTMHVLVIVVVQVVVVHGWMVADLAAITNLIAGGELFADIVA